MYDSGSDISAILFSNIKSLHQNPDAQGLFDKIHETLETNRNLIEKNKRIAKFVFRGLSMFQDTFMEKSVVVLDAQRRVAADVEMLRAYVTNDPEAQTLKDVLQVGLQAGLQEINQWYHTHVRAPW